MRRVVLVLCMVAAAQEADVEPRTIPLWANGAPGALGNEESDRPTLTIYRAYGSQSTGTGVVVCPGGGYAHLAMNHEGRQVANWLNAAGVTAFVLKYRLGPRYHHPIELGDAQRAIRLVRERAQEFGVRPDRVGIMGFSAGGHLAATTATHFDASSRPDFLILGYPVISFTAPYAHKGSVQNLVGDHPDPKLLENLSDELLVTAQTPPTFIFQTDEDKTVPAENAVSFYLALRKAGVPAELHVFQNGPHGVGLDLKDPALGEWPRLLANWLRLRGLI
ncbi:MAG TPA: alpha/beta hydrolase [Bryobacteraceae bacterium]|nr:alpha/beta hydrolase [Bryobacteraceae bacterium]